MRVLFREEYGVEGSSVGWIDGGKGACFEPEGRPKKRH